jgi:LysM repeat protein
MSAIKNRVISFVAWLVVFILTSVAVYLAWGLFTDIDQSAAPASSVEIIITDTPTQDNSLGMLKPAINSVEGNTGIRRKALLYTIIPNRPRQDVKKYKVSTGDSVFEIASKFGIRPETVLWANYEQLDDNPDMIAVDMELMIPPVDGVYYEWQSGDTFESIAARFEASIDDLLSFSGNELDLTAPILEPGKWVMVPGGHREFRQWIIPVIPRGRAGVSSAVYGSGACSGSYEGAYGSGAFIWPAGNHIVSGNDYWSGHLGIDIAAGEGAPIYAADSGVVVFAGWATGGYGNMVMIDHGNGYQSLFAHMSSVTAVCGQSISAGRTIGYSGSTGNSTGPHLHFEVRYQGGFVNPWFVLPAP